MPLAPLPIDSWLGEIAARVRERRALVLTAAPGAGKTTRVPAVLQEDGPVIVLQPRRVAARSIARRIADERGWVLGREVGWHVRFERRFGAATRVLLATEGILTARLQQDPLLSQFRTIVLDEFHERSIHADLGLALARQAWLARDDLRLVVMSATMDAGPVAEYLGGCPVLSIAGQAHEVAVTYAPGGTIEGAAREALATTTGNVLCFLPGAPEIRRAHAGVAQAASGFGADVVMLHGSLPSDEQDAALTAAGHRRVILATNIAETSLTVPEVRAVVDTGLHKVARYDPGRAIDSLQVERISQDAAAQRAGRAGRLGPGAVWRLWDGADRLRPHSEAEIHRIDLAGPILEVLGWGGDPDTFAWFEPPVRSRLEAARDLLRALGALEKNGLSPLGRRMQALPLHPRLARILLEAEGSHDAALACALLSERQLVPRSAASTTSDLLSAITSPEAQLPHVMRVAGELHRLAGGSGTRLEEKRFRRALLAGYPDRVAARRAPGSPRVLMASGHGAVVGQESGVGDGEFLLALDVTAAQRGDAAEARIRIASIVDREWLEASDVRVEHVFDEASGAVRAMEREYYGALVLAERHRPADPLIAASLLADGYMTRGLTEADEQLVRRLRFAGIERDARSLATGAAHGRRTLREMVLADALSWDERQRLDSEAPQRVALPRGRSARLEYREDGGVMAEVKLQHLFGVLDTPVVGSRGEPVLLAILAPNGRPVQLTRDLRSFWDRTYADVRKELRGRYPKHDWPEKP